MKNYPYIMERAAEICFVMAIAVGLPCSVSAHDFKQGAITIAHPFIRLDTVCDTESTRAQVMLLINQGKQTDKLLAADLKGNIKGKLMAASPSPSLQSVPAIEIPASGQTALTLPSYAIEFPVSSKNFQSGSAVSGTLRFERAGAVTINFMIDADQTKGTSCNAASSSNAKPPAQTGHGHKH